MLNFLFILIILTVHDVRLSLSVSFHPILSVLHTYSTCAALAALVSLAVLSVLVALAAHYSYYFSFYTTTHDVCFFLVNIKLRKLTEIRYYK